MRRDATAIVGAEHILEHGLVPEQRAARVDVLDEPPQFAQGVLDRRGRQQQHGRCPNHLADAVRHEGLRALLVVDAGAVVAAVNPGEDLVRLVDQAEVPGRGGETRRARLATRVLPPREKDALPLGVDRRIRRLERLDVEQIDQLRLPLAKQRTRNDDEDPRRAFREQLGDHEARLDRLAQPDLVRKDAAAFRNPPQGEHHRVDLVGVRVHAAAPLGGHLAAALAGATLTHEVLGVVAAVNGVHGHEPEASLSGATAWSKARRSGRTPFSASHRYNRVSATRSDGRQEERTHDQRRPQHPVPLQRPAPP